MKKMILSMLLICGIGMTTQAQTKSDFWTGGNVAWNTSKTDGSSALHNFKVLPEFGYQFHDNWGVGVQLGYTHGQSHAGDGCRNYSNGVYVSPFVRYAYVNTNKISLFIDGGGSYGYNKVANKGTESHLFTVGFRPGIGVKLTDCMTLTGKAGFLGYEYSKVGNIKSYSGGLDVNLDQIEVGMIFTF